MRSDYFAVLGLAPGRYDTAEIARRFQAERDRLMPALRDSATYADARRRLDDLHLAYTVLRSDDGQAELLRSLAEDKDAPDQLRRMIAAALEDGLLRYSRRRDILEEARRLGLSDFQTQLLIAQVQFGDGRIEPFATTTAPGGAPAQRRRSWPALAAAGVLALGIFFALVRWLGH